MAGADIIIGWVPEDTTYQESYIQRRHSVSLNQRHPVFDEDLSKDLEEARQEDGVTFLHFTRDLFPCADEVFYSIIFIFCHHVHKKKYKMIYSKIHI